MKGPIIGIVIVLALLATGAIFYASDALQAVPAAPVEQTYANDLFEFSFSYPTGYLLAESEVGVLGRTHHVISIIKEEDAVPRVNSEGPTAVTVDIYQNDTKPQTLEEWAQSDESNAKLGDGVMTEGTVDGAPSLRYTWSGLYQGETTVFLHNDRIVAVSVTYMSQADDIYAVYGMLLNSLRLR